MKYNLANNESLEINGSLFVKGLGGYDGANSQTEGVKTVQTVVGGKADKSYVDNQISPLNSKIGDESFTGVFCLNLGSTMSDDEFATVYSILNQIVSNNKYAMVLVRDIVDGTYLGDCEIVYKANNIITIEQAKISGKYLYTILYKFNNSPDATLKYSRTWSSINLDKQDKLTAGTGIDISSSNVISCTLDPTIFVVVDSLPTTPAASNVNKIHLVKDTTVEGNLYSEYLWVNNAWEKLGDFQPSIDLSNYVDKTSNQTITATKTFSSGINMNNTRIQKVQSPSESTDATNKKYVDDKYTALETKNTELTNKITTLETRIVELETIISRITITE